MLAHGGRHYRQGIGHGRDGEAFPSLASARWRADTGAALVQKWAVPAAWSTASEFAVGSDGSPYVLGPGNVILRLDPATGARLGEFKMPKLDQKVASPRWRYINVIGDYLIGGADPLWDPELDPKAKKSSFFTVAQNDNLSASKHLVVMNRHTGELLWTADARAGFRHNGICAGGGRLYAIDRLSGTELKRLARKNEVPDTKARIVAFDLETGVPAWESEDDVFGTWLSYSERYDILVESGQIGRAHV